MTVLYLCGSALAEDFANGKVSVDKEKVSSEFKTLQAQMGNAKPGEFVQAGLFKKHRYCVRCNDGKRLNCDVPVGGEVGRGMCASYGLSACGSGQVDYNGC
jgi:hypothetical protein